MSTTITPDVLSSAVSQFSAGANYPAGRYLISYVDGALQYAGGTTGGMMGGWAVNNTVRGHLGYHVTDGSGNDVLFPATSSEFASQSQCEAANAGESLVFVHIGGTIGMYLYDTNYNDNTAGSPAPTFSLASAPAPPPTLTATPTVANGVPGIILTGSNF